MLPSIRNPLDFDGDGVVSRSDFIPHFLDRDGDGTVVACGNSNDVWSLCLQLSPKCLEVGFHLSDPAFECS